MADTTRNINIVLNIVGNAKVKIDAFSASLQGVSKPVKALKNALDKSSADLGRYKKAFDNAGAGVSAFTQKLNALKQSTANYLKYRSIADTIIGIKEAFIAGSDAIIQYDQSLYDLKAITSATSAEVEQMGIKIKEVASTTKFSAQEVAEGMRTLGQAGFSSSEAVESMQAVSDLATGTLSDMAQTVDLVTTAMRVFKIEASDSARVADVFGNAVNRSKLTVEKLRTAMNYVGPVARSAGITFEEMSASMMTLANSGLRASTIGTGLRRVFAELVDPSDKLAAAAKRAGVSLHELDPTSNTLKDVISSLGLVVNDTQIAFDLFGKRGAAAVLALSDSEGQFASMLTTVGQSGTAAKMAATQMEGLGVSFKNLKDKMGLLAIAVGESGIAGAFKVFVDIARNVVDAFTAIIDTSFGSFLVSSALIITSIVGITAVLMKLATALKVLKMLTIATAALTASVTTLSGAATFAVMALNPLMVVLGLITAAAIYAFSTLNSAKEVANSATEVANAYGVLADKLGTFREKTTVMKKGSDELKEANLTLRAELLKTSHGMSEVADEAGLAADSINPLTGTIEAGSAALRDYAKALDELELGKLKEAAGSAGDNIDKQSSGLNRFLNRWKDATSQVGTLASGYGNSIVAMLEGDFAQIGKIAKKTLADTTEYGAKVQDALDFSRTLDDGKASFKQFSDYVNSLDTSNLTKQQEDLKEAFELLAEKSEALYDKLVKSGEVDLNDTVENIREIAEAEGIAGIELDALMSKVIAFKKAQEDSFGNIVEKWGKNLSKPKDALAAFAAEFAKTSTAITESDAMAIQSFQDRQTAYVTQLAKAKTAREEDLASAGKDLADRRIVYDDYYDAEADILKEASALQREIAESDAAQKMIQLQAATNAYEDELLVINDKYKDKIGLLSRYLKDAETRFSKARSHIVDNITDPRTQLAETKVNLKRIEEEYETLNMQLELGVIKGTITREKANAEKLNNEIRMLKEIELANIDTYEKIHVVASGSDFEKSAEKALLASRVKAGKKQAEVAKQIAEDAMNARKSIFDRANTDRTVAHASMMLKIQKDEASGVLTHDQAEKAKVQASVNAYEVIYQAEKKYLSEINKGKNPEAHEAQVQKVLEAERTAFAERTRLAEMYNRKVDTLNDNIVKKSEATTKELTKHDKELFDSAEELLHDKLEIESEYLEDKGKLEYEYKKKIKRLEEDLSDDIVKIGEDLVDDLDDLNDDRLANAKDLAADLAGIESDLNDDLKDIRQGGMSGKEKEKDNRKEAYKQRVRAEELARKAEKTGNLELLKESDDLYKASGKLSKGFSKAKKARQGVFAASSGLSGNAAIRDRIKEHELEAKAIDKKNDAAGKVVDAEEAAGKKKRRAKEDFEDRGKELSTEQQKKLKDLDYVHNESLKQENYRHTERMNGLDAEKVKLEEQLNVVKQISDVLTGAATAAATTEDKAKTKEIKPLKAKKATTKSGKQDVSKGSIIDHTTGISANLETLTKKAQALGDTLVQSFKRTATEASDTSNTLQNGFSAVTTGAEKGMEDFVVVTTESGKKIITTASSIAQGFNKFGEVIKTEPMQALKELGSALSDKKKNKLEVRTDEAMGKVNAFINSVQDEMGSIGDKGNGLSIMGPEEEAQIDKVAAKLGGMFEGLNTDDPQQKIQDMITTMSGMGVMDEQTFDSMKASLTDYVSSVEGANVNLKTHWHEGKVQVLATSEVLDEANKKVTGLSATIQSNPLKLGFDSVATKAIITNLQNIDGVVDNIHAKVEKKVAVTLNSEIATKAVVDLQEQVDNVKEVIKEPVELGPIEAPKKSVEEMTAALLKPIKDAKVLLENSPLLPVIDVTPIKDDIEGVSADLQALDKLEVAPTVELTDKGSGSTEEKLQQVQDQIGALGDTDIEVTVWVDADDLDDLVVVMSELASAPHTVALDTTVTGKEDVILMKNVIDSIISIVQTPLKVIVNTAAAIANVNNLYNKLDNLYNTWNNKVITIKTRYTSEGSPPSAAHAHGGEVGAYADGGGVYSKFKKLASPFINKGGGREDDVPAMLMKGEFVQKVSAVQKYGRKFMEMVNSGLYPIEKARTAVSNFASGGSVGSRASNALVQNFASGGAVLSSIGSSMRKRLLELLGVDVSMNVANVNVNQAIESTAENVTSEVGTSSLARMSDAFTNAVQGYAGGGDITQGIYGNEKQIIESDYYKAISEAKRAGKVEVADILTAERDELILLADTLRDQLLGVQSEYDDAVAERKLESTITLADIKGGHSQSVDEETASYNTSVNEDDLEHKREVEDHNLSSKERDAEHQNASIAVQLEYDNNSRASFNEYEAGKIAIADSYQANLDSLTGDIEGGRIGLEEAAKALNALGTAYGQDTVRNGANGITNIDIYSPKGAEAPDWKGVLAGIEMQASSPFVGGDAATMLKKSEQAHSTYLDAYNSLVGMGVKNPESLLPTALSMLGTYDPAKISRDAASAIMGDITSKDYDALRTTYTTSINDLNAMNRQDRADMGGEYRSTVDADDLEWNRYNEDKDIADASRDSEHVSTLAGLLRDYKKETADETNSLMMDLADLKEQNVKDKAAISDEATASMQDTKVATLANVRGAEAGLATNLGNITKSFSTTLTSLGEKDTKTSSAAVSASAREDAGSFTTIEELLKKLRSPLHFNTGGSVPHTQFSIPGKDSIMAALTPGEFVMQEGVVDHFGKGFFESLNAFRIPKFNSGGVVGTIANSVKAVTQNPANMIQHTLQLTVNGTQHEALQGSSMGIDAILNDLALSKMRT